MANIAGSLETRFAAMAQEIAQEAERFMEPEAYGQWAELPYEAMAAAEAASGQPAQTAAPPTQVTHSISGAPHEKITTMPYQEAYTTAPGMPTSRPSAMTGSQPYLMTAAPLAGKKETHPGPWYIM